MLALRELFGYSLNSANVRSAVSSLSDLHHGKAMSLTKRQREILTYLTEYSAENGYAPSFEEIASSSLQLARDGARASQQPRAKGLHQARVQREPRDRDPPVGHLSARLQLPLLGAVAAGMPIEAIQSQEMITVPDASFAAAAITTSFASAATR